MKVKIIIFLLISSLISFKNVTEKKISIGQKSYEFIDIERSRPLKVEVWYPTYDVVPTTKKENIQKEVFKKIQSIPNANFVKGKFPLIIVSHGTGGNRFSLTWLIEKMVKEEYIIVSLGHYGNTTFNKIPREFVKWWERAIDIQFVLNKILENNDLKQYIDESKIGGIGYSLGGYTNIALAGGLVDRNYHPDDKEDKEWELPPEFLKTNEVIDFQNDSLIVNSYIKYKDKVKDSRISTFFVMAPAIGFGFHSKNQTKNITAPIFIVAGKGDSNTPIEFNALNYHKLIDNSEIHLFDEKIGHYVFLNEATEFGKQVAPQIAVDRDGVDRKQIHIKTFELAVNFFNKNLKDKIE